MPQFILDLIKKIISSKYFYYILASIGVLLLIWILYSTITSKAKLEEKYNMVSQQLEQCTKINATLIAQISESQKQYQDKVNELMKQANKPVQYIQIPTVIEKPIYITTEDCQKMCSMIDTFSNMQKEVK